MRNVLILAIALLAGCTEPDRTTAVLSAQGFKEIAITGYRPFACSKDDTYQTGFEAKSPTGARVSGTVCAGLFMKGATVRFD